MFRRIALALSLAFSTALTACKGTENVSGTPIGGTDSRTLASMTPFITKSLTAVGAETAFGFPDQRTLVPPIILTYNVENSSKVSLGFPDMASTITSATLTDRSGTVTTLTILP